MKGNTTLQYLKVLRELEEQKRKFKYHHSWGRMGDKELRGVLRGINKDIRAVKLRMKK